ncbi:tetratricopeptide repeat protein, partial [Candidatus Magnetaquicoccus inordinatus]|uniref:O-linked N-acetylglucosamine transferase family protein n=1 Tax=Candidatus Magnetaquicoccus inordinatus TaxID=2496818 RepID=UPI00102CD320
QPNNPTFLNNLGIVYSSLGQREKAIECYRNAIAAQPNFYMALGNLGGMLADLNQFAEAIIYYQKALQAKPESCEVLNSLGNVLVRSNQHAAAIECYQKVLALQPGHADAYNGLATVMREQGNLEQSIAFYKKGLELHPDHYGLYNGLGSTLLVQGKPLDAIEAYQQAINKYPDQANAYHNVGNVLRDLGRLNEAIEYHQKALSLNPSLYQTHNSLGNVYQEQGQLEQAIACYQKALSIYPNDTDTLSNLALILTDLNRWDESLTCYQKAAALAPEKVTLHCDVLNQLLHLAEWQDIPARYQQMMQVFHSGRGEASPFVMLALPCTAPEQRENAERYMRNKYPARADLAAEHPRRFGERIKVGYFSSDFQNHPVAYLTAELFELHDRSRFEIYAYSFGPDDGREMRRRIMASADHFVDLRPLSHEASAQRIVADGIHILIDLNGFTKHARLQVLAMHPAPIQITWLGYLGTLGAPFIDYLLTDHFITPPGSEPYYTEKLLRLPECFQPNDRQRNIAEITPTRLQRGLPEQGFLFASFNKVYKINPDIFTVWMNILRRTPGSVLWLVAENQRVESNLRREAAARGVEPTRLYFVPKMALADYLANYRLVDLVLDTHPYNSGTTASNALWAGCPMLTCAGDTFVSRQAGSLLRNVGLSELVCHSMAEYEEVAVKFYHHPEQLLAIRHRLQANLLTSPLFDSPRFTRHLESAYQLVMQRYLQALPPDHISVPALPPEAIVSQKPTTNQNSGQAVAPPAAAPAAVAVVTAAPAVAAAPTPAPSPADLLFQQTILLQRQNRLPEAIACCQKLLELRPEHVEFFHLLGHLYFQSGEPQKAVIWIRKACQLRPDQPVFWQNLGIILSGLNELDEAIHCFRQVLALQPNQHEALHHLGNLLRMQGKINEAIHCLQQALAMQPDLFEVHNSLGNLLLAAGRPQEAIASYQQAVTLQPNHQNAYTNLGNVLLDQGRIEEAIQCYQKALAIQPTLCEAHNGMGNALKEARKLDEAIACFHRALSINPAHVASYHNLGVTLQLRGDLEEAIACYRKALAVQPNSHETYNNLGSALASQARTNEAIACYQKAIELYPHFCSAYGNIGIALQRDERLEEAVEYYRKALAINPQDKASLSNLGFALQLLGDVEQSIACYQQVLDNSPNDPEAHGSVLHQMLHICDWHDFYGRFARMMAAFHAGQGSINPFIMLSLPTTPEEQLQCAILSSDNKYGIRRNMAASRVYDLTPPRLKIGYFSCDYQDHATTHLMAELFEIHDRQRVETIAYSYGQDDGQTMRRRIIAASDSFVDLRLLSHQDAAQRILDDGVHILVEMKGYTKDSRLEVPALRPAPIQVSWLGYPGTVGADFIDYVLSDPFVSPPECASHFTEKIVRLDSCYQPNDRKRAIAPRTPTRKECGLPEEGFLFVCFNKNYKINPPIFDIWMRLLRATPGSLLWLFEANQWVVTNIRREAQERGVDPDRIYFAPKMPAPLHLARYRLADLVLDSYPYTSHTTGSDALWAAAPLITYAGQSFASRVAGSLLSYVGLPELVTFTLEDYEALAMELAHAPERLAEIKAKLQRNLPTAPLFDTPRFARSLEKSYAMMWERYRAGLAPDHIDVRVEEFPAVVMPQATRILTPAGTPARSTAAQPAPGKSVAPSVQPAAPTPPTVGKTAAPSVAASPTTPPALPTAKPGSPATPPLPADPSLSVAQLMEQYNAALKASDWQLAARMLEPLAQMHPDNPQVQHQALVLFKRVNNNAAMLQAAKRVWALNPAHFNAYQELINDCQSRQDRAGELALRLAWARRHPREVPTAYHLQEVYMALCLLLLAPLEEETVRQVEELQQLTRTIMQAQPVQEGDELYHSCQFYRASIEAVNMQAVVQPLPPLPVQAALPFVSASGQPMDWEQLRALANRLQSRILFYTAADAHYIREHARRFAASILRNCDLPCLILIHVIGGSNNLAAWASTVGIDDPRLLFTGDSFDPASVQAITWKINEPKPFRTPLVYFQSARFLYLSSLLEQLNLPILASDIDQLLQRGVADLLEQFPSHDVIFYEVLRNHKIADRFIAGLLLLFPTAPGKLFASFFRYYMEWALQDAEKKGYCAYFMDQTALLLARHHLLRMSRPQLGYFDFYDINEDMYRSFIATPFRFFTLYSGFDMQSLPAALLDPAAAIAAAPLPTVAEQFTQANALRNQDKPQAALALYERLLLSDPNHVEALIHSALLQARLGQISLALQRLLLARQIAPGRNDWPSILQPIMLHAIELYNVALKNSALPQAAALIAPLAELNPDNRAMQEQAFVVLERVADKEALLRAAKRLLLVNPSHFSAHQVVVDDCIARQDRQAEIAQRIRLARLQPSAIPPAFRLQEIYMAISTLLLNKLDPAEQPLIDEWRALAKEILQHNPVPESDPLYRDTMLYAVSIEAINSLALIQPLPTAPPWPSLQFAQADGKAIELKTIRSRITKRKVEIIFYCAADPVYVRRHARRYIQSLIRSCDLSFLVIIQVIGGKELLPELGAEIAIADDRLLLAADQFDPASIQAYTWRNSEAKPIHSPLVYYQSARFLSLGNLLELFQRPVITTDIDQLLQRGMRDLLERTAGQDVIFHERPRGVKLADRLIANLLLVYPSAVGQLFARFMRHYLEWAIQDAEQRGSYPYFLDQSALVMARQHLWQMSEPKIAAFERMDINTGMFGSYQPNDFRFFSFYSGFDMSSLPDGEGKTHS